VKRFEAIIAMQQHSKDVSTTSDNGATIEEVVFSMWSAPRQGPATAVSQSKVRVSG
jgi:hypothetical protein